MTIFLSSLGVFLMLKNNVKSVPKVNPPTYINWKDEQVQCKYRDVLSEMLPHFKVPVANNGAQQHVDIS